MVALLIGTGTTATTPQPSLQREANALGIMPLGLNDIECQILRALNERKESSLTNLSAKIGLTPECIRRDFEMYLQKHNLIQISTGGRSLTKEGRDYLKENLNTKA